MPIDKLLRRMLTFFLPAECRSFRRRLRAMPPDCPHVTERYGHTAKRKGAPCKRPWKTFASNTITEVYYIVRSHGQERSRHAYRLTVDGETCVIYNGRSEMSLQFDMLMLAVRGLCGLDADATPTLGQVEEMLRVANG